MSLFIFLFFIYMGSIPFAKWSFVIPYPSFLKLLCFFFLFISLRFVGWFGGWVGWLIAIGGWLRI